MVNTGLALGQVLELIRAVSLNAHAEQGTERPGHSQAFRGQGGPLKNASFPRATGRLILFG